MFDDEAKRNILQHTHDLWVNPEIIRRKQAGEINDDFRIVRYLVKLPLNQRPL